MIGRYSKKPYGWKDYNRACPHCGHHIPKYRRKCDWCGNYVKNRGGKVFPCN